MASRIYDEDPRLHAEAEALRRLHAKQLNGGKAPPKSEDPDKSKACQDLAGKIAALAMLKLVDPIKFQVDLPDNLKVLNMGVRRLEALIKPAYEKLARQSGRGLDGRERLGQRDEVEAIAQACELFRDADGVAYASVEQAGHRETWPVSSSRFRRYILGAYRRRHGRLAAGTALGIARLRPLVNIPDEREWILFVSWHVGCFRSKGPYPILIVNGEQGSAKTGTIKVARRLIDPAKVLIAKRPGSEEDLIIAAKKRLAPLL